MTRDFEYLPLRHVAAVKNSNVDKLSIPGESPVRLCNYVDVYRNDRITQAVSFMRASATPSEIASFKLRQGDVLITKDSEQWNDIGVPALVATESDDLVCGYHLTMLRPHPSKIIGSYLAYALRVPEVAVQLHLAAKGVTRYGLSQQGIKSALVPVPSLEEQGLIIRYLDHADLRIAKAIASKQQVLQLLRERQKQLAQSVVLGVPDGVKTVDSGEKWLGKVPAHWELRRMKSWFVERSVKNRPYLPLLAATQSQGVVTKEDYGLRTVVAQTGLENLKVVEPGDFVISLRSFEGGVEVSYAEGIISPAYTVLRPIDGSMTSYLTYLLKTPAFIDALKMSVTGIREGQNINYARLSRCLVPMPPPEERAIMVARLREVLSGGELAINAINDEIALLKEYRTRLIADVVTGKLDVRDEAAKLPDIDPMELATVAVSENGEDEEATDDN